MEEVPFPRPGSEFIEEGVDGGEVYWVAWDRVGPRCWAIENNALCASLGRRMGGQSLDKTTGARPGPHGV